MPRAGLRKISRYSGEFKATAVKLSSRGADSRCRTGTGRSPLYVVTLAQGSTGGKDCGQDEEAGH
jgi:transposase-like protein